MLAIGWKGVLKGSKVNSFAWKLLAVPAIAGILGFLTYSPMLQGRLGLIDDHEFLRFLQAGGQDLTQLPAMLATTELANYGDTARFRPVYYLLRAIETVIHGTDGFQWYLWRISLFAIFVFGATALVILLARKMGLSIYLASGLALIFGLTLLAQRSWTDIVMRLGPSELYLALGMLTMGYGIWVSLTTRKHALGMTLLTFGFIVSAGSKENALSLVWVTSIFLLLFGLKERKWVHMGLALLANLTFAIFVGLGFLPSILSSGTDVYGSQRSVAGWLGALVAIPQFWITLAATALLILVVWKTRPGKRALLELLLLASPLVLVVSDAFFYQYSVFAGSFSPARYGVVIEAMAILSLILLVIFAWGLPTKGFPSRTFSLSAAGLLALFPAMQIFTISQTFETSSKNAEYLNYQFQALESVSTQLAEGSAVQVLYVSDEPYDYERINASRQYFEVLSGTDPAVFLFTDFSNASIDQTTLPLAEELQQWSQQGNPEWKILPIGSLDQNLPTACVHFGVDPVNSPCSQSQWIGG